MAVCKYCGREIPAGRICTCPEAKKEAQNNMAKIRKTGTTSNTNQFSSNEENVNSFGGNNIQNSYQGNANSFGGNSMPNSQQGNVNLFGGNSIPNSQQGNANSFGGNSMPNSQQGNVNSFGGNSMPNSQQGNVNSFGGNSMPNSQQGNMNSYGGNSMPNSQQGNMNPYGGNSMQNSQQGSANSFTGNNSFKGKKLDKKIIILGAAVIAVIAIAAAIFIFAGGNSPKKIVNEFMDGVNAADTEKVLNTIVTTDVYNDASKSEQKDYVDEAKDYIKSARDSFKDEETGKVKYTHEIKSEEDLTKAELKQQADKWHIKNEDLKIDEGKTVEVLVKDEENEKLNLEFTIIKVNGDYVISEINRK